MKKKIYPIALICILAATYAFSSCGATATTTPATTSTALSSFATTLAEDMLVASPTASRSITGFSVNEVGSLGDTATSSDGLSKKKTALEALLKDTPPASCAITLNIQSSTNANCYGPSVSYTAHPAAPSTPGSWPGGDLGIWEANATSGEACASDQLNSRLKGVASYSDLGIFMMSGMACAANKGGIALPAVSSNQNITTLMTGNLNINGSPATVTSAIIYRDADVSGTKVFRYTLTATQGTKTYSLRTKHNSLDATDTTSRGKISVTVADNTGVNAGMNCSTSSANGSMEALSMAYEKTSATSATYLVKSARFCGNTADPFVSGTNFSVDLTKIHNPPTQQNGWADNANYFLAAFDPSKFTGQFYYAWQAGKGDSHTRTFNLALSGTSTVVTGSAFFGFGPTMQVGPGGITGMICAWTGPDQTHTPVAFVQRQNITVTAPATMFTASSSKVTYDPVAACETSTAMIMTWTGGTSSPRDASATTNDLVPVSEVATAMGTTPTSPTEVD